MGLLLIGGGALVRGVGEVGSTKVPQSLENLRSRKRQNKTGLELLGITAPKCMMYSQGSTFCLIFSHLELTLGSCSPSVNVKKISTDQVTAGVSLILN